MKAEVKIDNSIGMRGRVVVSMVSEGGEVVDRELVFKHPAGLRVRIAMAWNRMKRRQKKLAKVKLK